MVGHHRKGNARLLQHARRGEGEVLELDLAAFGEQGTYDDARALLDQARVQQV